MRKVIKESKFRVTLITGPPQSQTIEKIVDAPSEDIAVHRAQQAFMGAKFIQVMVSELDPKFNIPTQQASEKTQLPVQMAPIKTLQPLKQSGQQRENHITSRMLLYPYSITLPSRFEKILKESSPVTVNHNNGQHFVIIENENQMRNFLNSVGTNKDREGSRAILSGIRSSVR